jgi:hypothetical protein
MKKEIEALVIEKLGQLENNELENCPCGKKLAQLMAENPTFVKIYKNYKDKCKNNKNDKYENI